VRIEDQFKRQDHKAENNIFDKELEKFLVKIDQRSHMIDDIAFSVAKEPLLDDDVKGKAQIKSLSKFQSPNVDLDAKITIKSLDSLLKKKNIDNDKSREQLKILEHQQKVKQMFSDNGKLIEHLLKEYEKNMLNHTYPLDSQEYHQAKIKIATLTRMLAVNNAQSCQYDKRSKK
jgi:hypothetical protein